MPAYACLFARLFLTIDELMLHARDFHACAPARLFACPCLCLCLCVSVFMHSFKIIRIFSRMRKLQRIVMAISSAVSPLFNTFVIFAVVVSIFSVLAQQLYGNLMPEEFGTFSLSALTMFQT